MIAHVVLVRFDPGTDREVQEECARRLRDLPRSVPDLSHWRVGLNEMPMERAWDLAITGDFPDLDAVRAYRAHPAHREAAAYVDQHAAQTVSVDFDPAARLDHAAETAPR